MTRGDFKDAVRTNLADVNITYYSDNDLNDSMQDCYNEIVTKSYCLVKTATLSWQSDLIYYDFVSLGVTDYLGTIAIFNIQTNQWLRDDVSLRDFDRLRRDWEVWNGTPQFWASHSQKRIAVAPHLVTATGQFKLVYWAQAPAFTSDSDVPLVATDVQTMFWNYPTADLLEGAEEMTKALNFWPDYFRDREVYKNRCKRLCDAELLLRI